MRCFTEMKTGKKRGKVKRENAGDEDYYWRRMRE